ncbi:MAG: hypothetical protein U1F57_12165 [bacterium]
MRESKIGTYLASMPPSAEESIATDPKVKIAPGNVYTLSDAWKGLPQQLRVYLDQMGLKNSAELGVALEGPSLDAGTPQRWRIFQMSDVNNTDPVAPQGGSGTCKITPPEGKPTMNVSIGSFVAGTAMVVGIDMGIRKLFPDLPAQLRLPLNLGSIYAANYALSSLGIIKGFDPKAMTAQLPMMASLGTLSSILLNFVGKATGAKQLEFGTLGNELGSMGLTLGTYYTILTTPKLAGMAGGLINNGARLSWAAPAGGAGFAGGVGQALNVAGVFLIGNQVIGGLKEGLFYFGGYSKDPDARLAKLVYELELRQNATGVFGETAGGIIDGLLGHLEDGILCIGELVSDDVAKGREYAREEVKQKLLDDSEKFGVWARGNLVSIVAESTKMETGEIDWSAVESKMKDLYGKNAGSVSAAYQLLGYTGHISTDAQEVKGLLGADGSIEYSNREGIKNLVVYELRKRFTQRNNALNRLVLSMGVAQTQGNETYWTPPELLTPQQKSTMETQVKPLATEVLWLQGAINVLDPKK